MFLRCYFDAEVLIHMTCVYTFVQCSIVPTAFLSTTLIFVCFTLSALWAEQRKFLYLGGETIKHFLCSFLVLAFFNFFPKLYPLEYEYTHTELNI